MYKKTSRLPALYCAILYSAPKYNVVFSTVVSTDHVDTGLLSSFMTGKAETCLDWGRMLSLEESPHRLRSHERATFSMAPQRGSLSNLIG